MMQEIGSVAMVIELEWNKFVDTAIEQIKRRQYTDKIAEYSGKMLLARINYDTETKKHSSIIEKIQK